MRTQNSYHYKRIKVVAEHCVLSEIISAIEDLRNELRKKEVLTVVRE